jgi:hypothetical protein
MGQQRAHTNNNRIPNKLSLKLPQIKITYTPLQRGDPFPSTAGTKNPNTIWKPQPKQILATYFVQPLKSKDWFFKSPHTYPLINGSLLFYILTKQPISAKVFLKINHTELMEFLIYYDKFMNEYWNWLLFYYLSPRCSVMITLCAERL